MVIDIDQLAREALREEARDEQRNIAQATQGLVTLLTGLRGGGVRQHVSQRLEPHAFGRSFVELFGARKHGQHVYDVVLGVIVDSHALIA